MAALDVERPTVRSPTWRAVQNPWLVGALVIATFNLYALWWLGRTWWQLKQEDGDQGKRPVWHVLAMFVPLYGYFRFYAHIRTIGQVAATPAAREVLNPGATTAAWIVVNLLGGVALRPEAPPWMWIVSSLLCGALFGWAQYGLNTAWLSLPGQRVDARVRPLHWVVLGFGLALFFAAALATPYPES